MPILLFDSTHHALLAESVLEEKDFDIDIVPPPENAGADCGLAIKVREDDREAAEAVLKRELIEFRTFAE